VTRDQARLRAVHRQSRRLNYEALHDAADASTPLTMRDGFIIDPDLGEVTHNGAIIAIHRTAQLTFYALALSRGTLSASFIIEFLARDCCEETVRVHIGRIKKALINAGAPDPIKHVRYVGWRWVMPD
jgi:DNA-binding response OmpR family regulator